MPIGGVLENRRAGHRNRPLDPRNPFVQGLVGWWRMNEGAGKVVRDWSGQNNHGQMMNMDPVTDWGAGKSEYALDFDGSNDRVLCGNGAALQITGPLTMVGLWNFPSAMQNRALISKHAGSPNRAYYFGISVAGAPAPYVFIISSDGTTTKAIETATNHTLGWQQLAVVFVPTARMEIFRDGLRIASTVVDVPAAIHNSVVNLNICSHDVPGAWFRGSCAWAAVYNRGLSAAEIKQLYHNPDLPLWTPRQGISLAGIPSIVWRDTLLDSSGRIARGTFDSDGRIGKGPLDSSGRINRGTFKSGR